MFNLPVPHFDIEELPSLNTLSINSYNQKLETHSSDVKTYSDVNLHCIKQDDLNQNYELEIFETGNIATRENNWHDYFNLCVWFNFPKTKAAINYLHYSEIKNKTNKNRTTLENAMTLFDENGVVVLSTDKELLNLIREHKWKELFWEHREEVLDKLKIIIIGHSLYEKFLDPYIGMTAHSILLEVDDIELTDLVLDQKLSELLKEHQIQSPRDFQPLPVLGYPGWYAQNFEESFYDNKKYFRE